MLTDDQIDELIQPIVDRQSSISNYVIGVIARKVREIGDLGPQDVKKIKILFEMGEDVRKINEVLASMSNVQVTEIKSLIKIVALDSYIDAKPMYDYRHKSYIPYERNIKLQRVVTAVADITANTYKNLSNSQATGFLIRDLANPSQLKFQSIKDTYQTVIDEAIQAVQEGAIDYETAVRRTVTQLAESGIRKLYWESGYTQRLDTAVRRNILDGVNAINQRIQDMIGNDVGADGKEISVHVNSALDHEPVQGHAFKNEEYAKLQSARAFEDIKGNKFAPIERAITTWNCRHYAKSIILATYKPTYSQAKLNEYIRRNHEGYTLKNGKHLTLYDCTQYQRKLETKIRNAKDIQMALQESGDKQGAKKYRAKVVEYTNAYKLFSKQCGLRTKMVRTKVPNYRTKVAK